MDLDTLLLRYFATEDLATLNEDTLAQGCEQLAIDFAIEAEPSRKFALWVLMDGLGIAPSPADSFKNAPKLRATAEDWLRQTGRLARD